MPETVVMPEPAPDDGLVPIQVFVRPQNHIQIDIIELTNGFAILVNSVIYSCCSNIAELKMSLDKLIDISIGKPV